MHSTFPLSKTLWKGHYTIIMGDEDNFVAVFPSNAQPHIFPNNTAAEFSTKFETSKQLNGEWEVAVKDLSFVNTVQTFKNEKISVSKIEKETCKNVSSWRHNGS